VEIVLAHNTCDSGIIQIEGVPQAASIVGLCLHKDGVRGASVELFIRVFEEIAGVEKDPQPWRIDGIYDF